MKSIKNQYYLDKIADIIHHAHATNTYTDEPLDDLIEEIYWRGAREQGIFMKRHNLPEQGVIVRYGAYKRCLDCGEEIYSEREFETSHCPGKRLKEGIDLASQKPI